jgi:aminoglycoside 3-N-acetyltransferase I
MFKSVPYSIRVLGPDDVPVMEDLLTVFGEAFDEVDTYIGARPDKRYLERLLGSDTFIAVAALKDNTVVGGIAAYELRKFERERSEIYIYDLAVAMDHRREGIATALIMAVRKIAALRGAYVIFVQADHGDEAAIALYSKLGQREDVLHFDIAINEGEHCE